MPATHDWSPDAWLFPSGGGAPIAGTIVDTTRVLVQAPAEVVAVQSGDLRVVGSDGGGGWREARVVTGVIVLADGPVTGQVAALLTIADGPLVPRAGLLEEILRRGLLATPAVASTPDGAPAPEAIGLPPPPSRPASGTTAGAARVVQDHRVNEAGRTIFCMVFPWFCHVRQPHHPGVLIPLEPVPPRVPRDPRLPPGPHPRPTIEPIPRRPPWPPALRPPG